MMKQTARVSVSAAEPDATCTDSYRRILQIALANILRDTGIKECDQLALESLTEMFQSYISQLGKTAKSYCEVANRAQPLVADVSLALVESGCSLPQLKCFIDKQLNIKTSQLPRLEAVKPTNNQNLLHVKQNASEPLPSHIPEFMPSFPDKHTYVETPALRAAMKEYQQVREKASNQKRQTQSALTKLMAHTGQSNSLTEDPRNDINKVFPLIGCKPVSLPYLSALLPQNEEQLDQPFVFNREQDADEEPISKSARKQEAQKYAAQRNLTTDLSLEDMEGF